MLKAEEQMELAILKKHGASIRELSRYGTVAQHGSALFARWQCGGGAQAGAEAGREARSVQGLHRRADEGRAPDRIPATCYLPRDQGARL